ncbi:ArnT family glycosyltransferase [Marisediminicola senii]|uniref:ArnT family glycosyltransferase n=1 Tax=Marisediminicola senii TaxID=2711233 RepID=UPI0013ECEBC4|nr:glycosyltransferase family 39 protein [Marisediminicola senii]
MTTTTERPISREAPRPASAGAGSGQVSDSADRPRVPRRRLRTWFRAHRANIAWLSPVLLVSALVQAINLGGSPQRVDDEGTYTAQAWAVNNLGELAHYTYWYDHPPLAWLQVAAWTGATGGFQRYDFAVIAAREAMVIATLVSLTLLWFIARRLGFSRVAASVTALVFALSPLAVQFHRSFYLDNVAMPWLLASILLAMTRKHQLAGFAASAAALGVSVLSKETFLLALPLVGWLMWKNARIETRRYTLSVAATILVIIGGGYLLLATVKGELLPGDDRVSLFDGVAFQLASRDSSGSIFDPESLFSATTAVWVQLDPVIVVLAPLAAIAGLFIRRLRPFAIMLAFLIAFMFRPGGYLPVPYVLMMLPFAALLIVGVTERAVRTWRRRRGGVRRAPNVLWLVAIVAAVAVAVPAWGMQLRGLLLADLDEPARDAQSWIEENVPRDSRLIVDDIMWVDLVTAGFARDNVVWFYKLDTDPAVQAQSPNGWRDSDYIVTTDSMLTSPNAASAGSAVENSVVVASFGEGEQAVEVRRIDPAGMDAATTALEEAAIERAETGQDLLRNPDLAVASADAARLDAGQVDERVTIALAQLMASGPVTVDGFPIVFGEDDLPFRQVDIGEADGNPLVVDGRMTDDAETFVESLAGRYRPSDVTVVDGAVRLTFSIVAPQGVVS